MQSVVEKIESALNEEPARADETTRELCGPSGFLEVYNQFHRTASAIKSWHKKHKQEIHKKNNHLKGLIAEENAIIGQLEENGVELLSLPVKTFEGRAVYPAKVKNYLQGRLIQELSANLQTTNPRIDCTSEGRELQAQRDSQLNKIIRLYIALLNAHEKSSWIKRALDNAFSDLHSASYYDKKRKAYEYPEWSHAEGCYDIAEE